MCGAFLRIFLVFCVPQIGDCFAGCIAWGVPRTHANSDDIPWKDPRKSITFRVFRPFVQIMMHLCKMAVQIFPRNVIRIRKGSRTFLNNAPNKEVSKIRPVPWSLCICLAGWRRNRTGTGNRNRWDYFWVPWNRTKNRNRLNHLPGAETGNVPFWSNCTQT